MSKDVVLRAFFALILSLTLAWGVYRLDEQDRSPYRRRKDTPATKPRFRRPWRPFLSPCRC